MIGKGSKVSINSRENQNGIVLEVKDDFVQVNYQNKTEWFPISDLTERTIKLFSEDAKSLFALKPDYNSKEYRNYID